MAVSTFSLVASGASVSGGWLATVLVGGHNAHQCPGNQQTPELEGQFTGTQLEFFGFATGTNHWQVSIDGGAFVTLTLSTINAWAWNTAATGLTDALHTYQLKIASAGSNDYIEVDTTIRVTGAAPAASPWGTYQNVYGALDPAFTSYIAINGSPPIGTAGFVNYLNFASGQIDSAIRFRATTTSIQAWYGQLGAGTVHLTIANSDGSNPVEQTPVTLPTTGLSGWVTIATGLSGVEQLYTLSHDNGNGVIWGINLGTGTLNTTTPIPRLATLALYGDSITFGQGASTVAQSWAYLISRLANMGTANRGIASTSVHHFSLLTDGETRFADITGLSPAAARIVILYGTNDMSQLTGAETTGQFLTSYTNMLNSIIAGTAATVRIYALYILQRADISDATRLSWNAQITAAAAACTAPGRVTVIDTTNWIDPRTNATNTPGAGDLFDGTHPNNLGHAKIALQIAAQLRGPQNRGLMGGMSLMVGGMNN